MHNKCMGTCGDHAIQFYTVRIYTELSQYLLIIKFKVRTYILLTKREGRTGRISARGLDSTDLAALGPYKKDRGPIFSQYGPEQAWLIRDLLHD